MTTITGRIDVVRDGAPHTVLNYSSPPTITMVSSAEICLAMQGEFLNNPAVNYLTDELVPICIIDDVEYQMGVFVPGTVETRIANGQKIDAVEAYDRTLKVKQTRLEKRLYIAKGTKYSEAIKELLFLSGISIIIEDASAEVLQTDREEWEVGTSHLAIINELLAEINFYPLWFDLKGYAHLERITSLIDARIDHTYRNDEASIITDASSSTLDVYDAANVFVAIYNNPETDEVWTATAVNDQAFSSLSTVRRGRRIMADPIRVDNIASQAALQEYVDNIRNESLLSTEVITFSTALNPVHQINDIVAIDNDDLQGIYEETGWIINMGPGQLMQHTARRILVV